MKYLLKKYLSILFVSLAFCSCEKIIDMDIENNDPKLVLIACLTPDSVFNVSVTKSIHILDIDTITYISNAQVKIFENNEFVDSLTYNRTLNSYISNRKKPVAGKTYRIEASSTGYKSVSTECTIPIPVNITLKDTSKIERINLDPTSPGVSYSGDYDFKIDLSLIDPAAEKNYYIISISQMHFMTQDTTKSNFPYYFYSTGFRVKSLLIEYASNANFLDFNVVNSDDGFGGSEDNYIYATQIAFSDKAANGKTIDFSFIGDFQIYDDSVQYQVTLTSISEDYFKYISSDANYKDSEGPFTEKVQMYNNIKNGLGILLGGSSTTRTFTRYRNVKK
jgi:hypothetical protein